MYKVVYDIRGFGTVYLCDTIEDLKDLPQSPMGSRCRVVSTDEWYQVDSSGANWYNDLGECIHGTWRDIIIEGGQV